MEDTAVSSHPRYRYIGDSMRVVARREPTLALHVHVGVARRQAAIRVMNRLRVQLPLLLALSANRSPPGSPARIARTCRSRWIVATSRFTGGLADQRGAASRAAGEPNWTRNRFARDLALAPNDLIQRGITRLAYP
jgi:Glutamate-cysteine ligase family 2(GCS2)